MGDKLMKKGSFEIRYNGEKKFLRISRERLTEILENNYVNPEMIIIESINHPLTEIKTSPYSDFRYNPEAEKGQ